MKNRTKVLVVILAGFVIFWIISSNFWDSLFILVSAVFLTVWMMAWWNIFQRAGYKGRRGLLMFVPILNFIMLFMFAFKEWPLERRAREQERELVEGDRRKS